MTTAPSPATALVVGGRGFLGRHIVEALTAAGYAVVTTSRVATSTTVALDLVTDAARELRAVLRDSDPTVVVNCAGLISGTAQHLTDGNVVAPGRLLTAVAAVAPSARFVHLGSAAEYGTAGGDGAVDEEADPRPLGDYGVTKLAGTRAVLAAATDAGVSATVLRVFNPVGGGAPVSTLPGRLARLLREVAPGEPLSVGPLGTVRDFVDVRDVAAAVLAAVTAEIPGPVYNVGSGRGTVARELAERLVGLAGFRGSILEAAPPSDRSAGVARQQADISRAARELGWSPRYDLSDSLLDLWRFPT